MIRVDFKPDVDGFAFANQWSFDERERGEIERHLKEVLPIAAAALTPIVMAAFPAIAPVAGLALGPVLPLLGVALPVLPLVAPYIAEQIIDAVADALVKGNGNDNLCGGMTAAALDYHCLRWVLPRGTTQQPLFDPNNPTSLESVLRKRIWDGQIESHLDNTPRIVLWKTIASVFGDWGRDWLRDRTREELAKIEAALATGNAVPIGIVWTSDAVGHIVVGYALERHGPDTCSVYTYDNERPDVESVFDIDLSTTPIWISRRGSGTLSSDGIMLGTSRFQRPLPALSINGPVTAVPANYSVRYEQGVATFAMRNHTPWTFADVGPGLRSNASVVAPNMAFMPPSPPTPIAASSISQSLVQSGNIPVGWHLLEAVALVTSGIAGVRVSRVLPKPDGSPADRMPYLINPRLALSNPDRHTGSGCARMAAEGEPQRLHVDTAPVSSRGVTTISWSMSDGTNVTGTNDTIDIASIPLFPNKLTVNVTVTLTDGTECRSHTELSCVPSAIADRNQKICELSHMLSRTLIARVPRDVLINPVRAAVRKDLFDFMPAPMQMSEDIQKGLKGFLKK